MTGGGDGYKSIVAGLEFSTQFQQRLIFRIHRLGPSSPPFSSAWPPPGRVRYNAAQAQGFLAALHAKPLSGLCVLPVPAKEGRSSMQGVDPFADVRAQGSTPNRAGAWRRNRTGTEPLLCRGPYMSLGWPHRRRGDSNERDGFAEDEGWLERRAPARTPTDLRRSWAWLLSNCGASSRESFSRRCSSVPSCL